MDDTGQHEVTLSNVRPPSRLPRPVKRGKVRLNFDHKFFNSPVSSGGSPSVKLPTVDSTPLHHKLYAAALSKNRRMDESTFPPIPGSQTIIDTSSNSSNRMTANKHIVNTGRPLSTTRATGKYAILHKIQDKPSQLITAEGDESRFTKFYPLPAIGCSTPPKQASLDKQDNDQQTDTSQNSTTTTSPVQDDINSLDDLTFQLQSPPMTRSSIESRATEDSDDHSYVPHESTTAIDLYRDEDNETATDILFHKVDIEDTAQFCNENRISERPKTSFAEQSRPSKQSEYTARPLKRSNTYDILPTVQEGEDDGTEEDFKDDSNEEPFKNSLNSSVSDKSQHQALISDEILLCIQTSKDENYTYGYFKHSDSLQHVLDFVCEMQQCSFGKCKFRHENETKEVFTDLTQTIGKVRLKHRSLLRILADGDN